MQILKTSDYSIFKKHPNNRDIYERALKRLVASISACNMLEFRPILVTANMEVIDGQHRLEAAKKLGLEVYYQVKEEKKPEDIILLNANQKIWDFNDYLTYYVANGNPEYIKMKNYCDKKNIQPSIMLQILGLKGGPTNHAFKSGTFKFPEQKSIDEMDLVFKNKERVIEEIRKFSTHGSKVAKSNKFIYALTKILKTPDMNVDMLISKLAYKSESIHPRADMQGYFIMLRDIYNWKNHNPIE